MTKRTINIGTTPNDSTGDTLRTAFDKVNQNFTELYSAIGADVQIPIQTGNNGKFLKTDGTVLSWSNIPIDLSSVGQHIIPTTDNTYDLGNSSHRFRHIYVGPGSLNIGGVNLSLSNGKLASSAGFDLTGSDVPTAISATSASKLKNGDHELTLSVNGGGAPYVTFPAADGDHLVIQGSELFTEPGTNGLSITAFEGNIRLSTHADSQPLQQWTFDRSGNITLPPEGPGTIKNTAGPVNLVSSIFTQLQWTTQAGAESADPNGTEEPTNWLYVDSEGAWIETNKNTGGTKKTWMFGTDGNLNLPVGGDIVDSNGTSVLGGGASTGNVTFSTNKIIGTNNSLILKAEPDSQYITNYGVEIFNSIDNDTHLSPLSNEKGIALGFAYNSGLSHIRVEGRSGQGGSANSGNRVGIVAAQDRIDNLYFVGTDFTNEVDTGGGTIIHGMSQRNETQIEVDLFVPNPSALRTKLLGMGLAGTIEITYETGTGTNVYTGYVSQLFTDVGQADPDNGWTRLSGRIDGTVPTDYLSIAKVNIPDVAIQSAEWIFDNDGLITLPNGTTLGANEITVVTAGESFKITTSASGPHPEALTFEVLGSYIKLPTGNGVIKSGVLDKYWQLDALNNQFVFPNNSRVNYTNQGALQIEVLKSAYEDPNQGFSIHLHDTNKDWTFTPAGGLTFPDDTTQSTAFDPNDIAGNFVAQVGSKAVASTATGDPTGYAHILEFAPSDFTQGAITDVLTGWRVTGDNGTTGTLNKITTNGSNKTFMLDNYQAWNTFTAPYTFTSLDFVAEHYASVNINVGTQTWEFKNNGEILFPDETTVAGSATVLAPGNNYAIGTSRYASESAEAVWTGIVFEADISAIDDITLVQVGWTTTISGHIYTVSNTYSAGTPASVRIIEVTPAAGAPAANFVQGQTYTFISNIPTPSIWVFGNDGAITTPGAGTIQHINNDLKVEVTGTDVIVLRTNGGDVVVNADASLTVGDILINNNSLIATQGRLTFGDADNTTKLVGKAIPVKIQINDNNNDPSKTWLFGVNGSLTFPDNTVQTTAYRVKSAPIHSYGDSGDQQGDLAFDSTNFYYCISNYGYVTETFTVVNAGEYSNIIIVNKASNPNYTIPQEGWTTVIGGVTMTLTAYSGNHMNGVDYNFAFDNSPGAPLPSTVTFTSTSLKNIWVKQQWGTTGSW